ncbi:putative tail fiber protein [Pectobacterium phage PP101]|uniref:Putative tail fiber protein n=1 Tax=Pectobacterium phage PP101 TaxID=1916414 RepID=A0A1J0MF35_9CAUD|nr:putative tail fiber protein [Pectobacterium phage PP101]APD19732.1 putative tail fiber protein [Pectobacterium phage PP101]
MAKGWSFSALINALRGAAFLDVGTSAGTVAAGDDSRVVNAVQQTGDTMSGSLAVRVNQAAIALRPVADGQTNYLVGKNAANNLDVWFVGLRDSDSVKFGRQGYGELYFKEDGTSGWVNTVSGQSLSFNNGGDIFYRSAPNGVHYFNSDVEIQSSGISLKIAPDADNEPSYIAGSNAAKTGTTWRVGKIGVGADVVVANLVSGQAIGLSSNGNMYYDVANSNFQHVFGQTVTAPNILAGGLTITKNGGDAIVVKPATSGGAGIQFRNASNIAVASVGVMADGTAELVNSQSGTSIRISSGGVVSINSPSTTIFTAHTASGDVGAFRDVWAGNGTVKLTANGNLEANVGAVSVWGVGGNLKSYIDNGLATKLGVNSNAVSATKLQTARKINGVLFDGTQDINLDLGVRLVAYGAYANFANTPTNITAVTSNTVTFTFAWGGTNNFVKLGTTKVVFLESTATELVPNQTVYKRFGKLGEFVITGRTPSGSNQEVSTFTVDYPNHGIAIGQSRTIRLSAFIYEQVGLSCEGNIVDNGSLWASLRLELATEVSTQTVPTSATTPMTQENAIAYFGSDTLYGSNSINTHSNGVATSANILADRKTINLCTINNSSDTRALTSLTTVKIYDYV